MTKLRTPLTFADAMTRVAGVIGWAEACRITGRADRTARAWSDPETRTVPPVDQAMALDAAYLAAGGEGAPFLDAYMFQLDVTRERQEACRHSLVAEVATLSRELGEAIAATLSVSLSNASPRDVHRAFAEVTQAAAALDAVQRRLASFLPSTTGSAAGNTGGSND